MRKRNAIIFGRGSSNRGSRFESLERRVLLNATPAGGEFRVNVYTSLSQYASAVAPDGEGNFVVVWQSLQQENAGWEVYGRRYSAAGAALSGEFRVNTYTTGNQVAPDIAMDADGDFVVTWFSQGQDGSGYGIYAQRFDAQATTQGPEFRVNTYTTGSQRFSKVAMSAQGDFVITWWSPGQDGSDYGVYAQRYNGSGVPQGGEFRANTYTTGQQARPAVAMSASGEFIIAWSGEGPGDNVGIHAQRYNASGVPQSGQFLVNTYTTNTQNYPAVAMDADGDFVIAWNSYGQDGSHSGVFAQRFNAAGMPQGSEFRVNQYTTSFQSTPSVAMDPAGNFVIAWESDQDVFDTGIYARRYSSGGAPLGDEFRVHTYTTGRKQDPDVAINATGNFVVTWTSDGQDGSFHGIYGQRFTVVSAPAVTASEFLFQAAPHQLQFRFNQNVSASLGFEDIMIQQLPGGPIVTPTALSYNTSTNLATFTLPGVLADGNYRATLLAAGITSPGGTPMAADHVFDFFFLRGDANRDARVDLADFNILAGNFGQSPRAFSQGDFNYDGVVNLADFNVLAARFGIILAGGGASSGRSAFDAGADGSSDDDRAADVLV